MKEAHATKDNTVVLKIYNNPSKEQLCVSSVKLRHKDKVGRCKLFCSTRWWSSTIGDARYRIACHAEDYLWSGGRSTGKQEIWLIDNWTNWCSTL